MDGRTETRAHELVIERDFAAPAALLFKMWTEPEHMARWWGCDYMVANKVTNDLRVGGAFRSEMTLEGDRRHTISGVYREIDPPLHVAFTWTWNDWEGNQGPETLVFVTLIEEGAKTRMTLRHTRFETAEQCDSHREGWTASMERLAGYVAA